MMAILVLVSVFSACVFFLSFSLGFFLCFCFFILLPLVLEIKGQKRWILVLCVPSFVVGFLVLLFLCSWVSLSPVPLLFVFVPPSPFCSSSVEAPLCLFPVICSFFSLGKSPSSLCFFFSLSVFFVCLFQPLCFFRLSVPLHRFSCFFPSG